MLWLGNKNSNSISNPAAYKRDFDLVHIFVLLYNYDPLIQTEATIALYTIFVSGNRKYKTSNNIVYITMRMEFHIFTFTLGK